MASCSQYTTIVLAPASLSGVLVRGKVCISAATSSTESACGGRCKGYQGAGRGVCVWGGHYERGGKRDVRVLRSGALSALTWSRRSTATRARKLASAAQ